MSFQHFKVFNLLIFAFPSGLQALHLSPTKHGKVLLDPLDSDRLAKIFSTDRPVKFDMNIHPIIIEGENENQCTTASVLCALGACASRDNLVSKPVNQQLLDFLRNQETNAFVVPTPTSNKVLANLSPEALERVAQYLQTRIPKTPTGVSSELLLLHLACLANDPSPELAELRREIPELDLILTNAKNPKIFDQTIAIDAHNQRPIILCTQAATMYFNPEFDYDKIGPNPTQEKSDLKAMLTQEELAADPLEMLIIFTCRVPFPKSHTILAHISCTGLLTAGKKSVQIDIYDTNAGGYDLSLSLVCAELFFQNFLSFLAVNTFFANHRPHMIDNNAQKGAFIDSDPELPAQSITNKINLRLEQTAKEEQGPAEQEDQGPADKLPALGNPKKQKSQQHCSTVARKGLPRLRR